ncbi:MAG: NAD(P)-dependent oxidoreductase [Planctomycetes bacterium]|nr:NAD(P)-dependent oxidoreductase [Planctomycetota bacterium]
MKTEEELIQQMTTPSERVKEAVAKIKGDIMILGVAGKMGPTLAELLVRAGAKSVIGVARFSKPDMKDYLKSVGVKTIKCDLLDDQALADLPDAPNIYMMAGFKFGATGNEPMTWAMNTMLPGKVMQRFSGSRVVYISSGNVYNYTNVSEGGADESSEVGPIGEYAQSRLGGERLVQFHAERHGTPTLIVRLFYATELRYGIVLDIATKIREGKEIDLSMGHVNQIWQGDANSALARSFPLCESPARIINLTGKEILSVREIARKLGKLMDKAPKLVGTESKSALLADATACERAFGPTTVSPDQIIEWVAWWVSHGGETLGKPTKYESRTGRF